MIFIYECIAPKKSSVYKHSDASDNATFQKVSFLTFIYIVLYLTDLPAAAFTTTRAGGSSKASARGAV